MRGRGSILAWLAFGLGAGCGGVEVRGKVWDGRTHRPLAGAVVQIADQETTTGPSGEYRLVVEPRPQDQPVLVAAPGYSTLQGWRPVGRTTPPIWLHFDLQPLPVGGDEPPPPAPAAPGLPAEESVTAGTEREAGSALPAGAPRGE